MLFVDVVIDDVQEHGAEDGCVDEEDEGVSCAIGDDLSPGNDVTKP